ncbi:MAG TPA: M20/M25/M40 family metallo-hydrolase [Bryobacteraceae bacterium]|nr:M20/M25/M40 family metallo-hydrolase [Bryobacteraceae bacterium]
MKQGFLTSLLIVIISVATSRAADETFSIEQYRPTANKLIDAALDDREGYAKLAYLCDRIGNRLSGSASLDRAIQWAAEQMKRDGLSNVRLIPAKIPHWVRGNESARLLAPIDAPLHMLGIGMSVGTPPEGITADVVVVTSFDELSHLDPAHVKGKIVVYNEEYRGYGPTVAYRTGGASRAAALGAAAVLVRSVTPLAMQIPHTGALNYDEAHPKIPAAAISIEDTLLITRLAASGVPVRVKLVMGAHQEPDVDSANVAGEIVGRERPEEVVVLGGHIDSWDVGRGAQDDGSGIIACLQAVALMKKLNIQPRRTVRVVFWVNEENGGRGGEAYRDWLGDKVSNHVAAIEMDGGAEAPQGFGYGAVRGRRGPAGPPAEGAGEADASSLRMLQQVGKLLDRIGAGEITPGGGGSDIAPITARGVPSLGLRTVGTHYFDWHHTETDTLDKVDPQDFRKNIAALAVMSYVLAEMPGRLAGSTRPGKD